MSSNLIYSQTSCWINSLDPFVLNNWWTLSISQIAVCKSLTYTSGFWKGHMVVAQRPKRQKKKKRPQTKAIIGTASILLLIYLKTHFCYNRPGSTERYVCMFWVILIFMERLVPYILNATLCKSSAERYLIVESLSIHLSPVTTYSLQGCRSRTKLMMGEWQGYASLMPRSSNTNRKSNTKSGLCVRPAGRVRFHKYRSPELL